MALFGALLFHWLAAGVSLAEGPNVWDGAYMGTQLGGATNSGCSRWLLSGVGMPEQIVSQTCGSGSLVGGAVIGENFQYKHIFLGVSADIDFATGKKATNVWSSIGQNPSAGTYRNSERVSPDGFIVFAPRVGYAGREWAPYVKAGVVVAFGGRNSSTAYTPTGGTQSTATFNGDKSFNTIGWAADGGVEWGLYGPWSIGFEYMHMNLGKGSSSFTRCAGTPTACAGFSGTMLENVHGAAMLNTYQIGLKYYFNYW